MRNLAVLGAAALLLAVTVAGARAQPTTQQLLDAGNGATFQSSNAWATNPTIHEGRAAALAPADGGFSGPDRKGR